MVTMLEQKLRKCLDFAQKCARIVSNYCGQDFESMKAWHVIGAGVVVHLILFYSIFDIYFTSPLVHGMTPVVANVDPPAKRLVLFVADGLRADKFFGPDDNNELRAAYLRSVIEDAGVWGVSHTRVPTESRPGHVALIAGFYEDVSAVAKGWKENPVEFDSVFNESRYTWSWGSPDILPMFAKGATGDHVMVNCYPPHLEDFAGGSNIMELDVWVFKEFKKFLNQAKVNETLNKMLKQDKLVFFLHLLGIDTHGHANKPDSVEYSKNIRYVDHKIQEVVYMLEDFYEHDRRTAYIVTSDHGMTDWGSHGAGDPHETLTPIVAWGAGIRKPKNTYPTCGYFHDNFCDEWVLGHKGRTDISQADVAPLMSFLIGAALPLNSVGVLPLDYLNGTEEMMAEAAYANAAQILAQYQVKMRQVKDRTISFTFRPFKELPALSELEYLSSIRNLIARGWYSDAIHESKFAIEAALRGLRYYQTYDRSFLGVSITMGFLGWVGYVLRLVLSEYSPVSEMYEQYGSPQQRMRRNIFINQVFSFIGFVILFLLVVQSLPLTNYLYCLMPVVLWLKFVQGWDYVVAALKMAMAESVLKSVLIYIVIALLGVEVAVMCFFYRVLVSFLLVAMGFWVFFTPLLCTQLELCICWLVSCVAVAVFPLLPVVGHNAYTPLVLLAGSLAVFLGIIIFAGLWRDDKTLSIDVASKIVLSLQLGMVALATVIVKVTTDRVADKRGPPFLTQCLSWFMLFAAPLLSLFTGVGLEVRLFSLALGLLVPYILLSITYEGLFLLFLMGLLCFWIKVESGLAQVHDVKSENMNHFRCDIRQAGSGDSVLSFSRVPGYGPNNRKYILEEHAPPLVTRHLELADLRRALFFIVLIVTGFFGTGNIASINSFDTASIYCFLTVFNPFVMGGMLMVKVLLPFMVVTCVLRTVQVVTRAPLHGFILLVSMLSSFMGLNFFFLVRDYGSWLEIGTSISHYIITMSITVFVSIMIGLSQLLTSASLRPAALRKLKCDDEEEEDDDHRS